ncbi:Sec-independent protein translocase subunit TatA [Kitasatospora sp. NPDC101157]|uniref:Sec-independent protein translocase subunit TatA n=1 Tax=Kitasatospora sp. NPDC101157 TaxID=3364098 RepID=UPI003809635F
MRISMTGIVVIVVLAIVLFGAKRLPELARSLGQSMRILKSEARGLRSDGEKGGSVPSAAPPVDGPVRSSVRTVQSAPGASATARPVAGPDGDAPH